MKIKRIKNNYRGSKGQWTGSEMPNPFGSCLFCKDCKKRLTPIRRNTANGYRKYYICSTYNTKGKHYCFKAHLIEENDLREDIITYIKLCRNSLCETIASYDLENSDFQKHTVEEKSFEIQQHILEYKKQLNILFHQKIRDLSNTNGNEDIINESYDTLQEKIFSQINELEIQLEKLNTANQKAKAGKEESKNALDVIDCMTEKGVLDRKDIEILIERIEVDENGFPEIYLKYGCSKLINHDPSQELNCYENEIIYHTMKLIQEEDRGYTSAKHLTRALTEIGYPKSKKSVLPYIILMIDMNILQPTKNSLKPYTIIKTKTEIQEIIDAFYTCRVYPQFT